MKVEDIPPGGWPTNHQVNKMYLLVLWSGNWSGEFCRRSFHTAVMFRGSMECDWDERGQER